MKLLVTGATGFIGRALVPQLVEAGHSVRIATRSPSSHFTTEVEQEVVPDLGEVKNWDPLLKGVEGVIHLAGLAHVIRGSGSVEESKRFHRANVAVTRELLQACLGYAITKFIFISSLHVVASQARQALSENAPPRPDSEYAKSKLNAEQLFNDLPGNSAVGWTILRPPLVYGPGQKANMARLVQLIGRGWPLPFGSINNQRSFIGIDNLCHLIMTCLRDDRANGQVFHCADGEPVSTSSLIYKIGEIYGKQPILISVPGAILRLFARVPGMGALAKLSDSLFVDQRHVQQQLGWRPPLSMDEGLGRMLK